MKKMFVRLLAIALVLVTAFALCSTAFAEKVSSVSQTSTAKGDCKKTFYVKTNSNVFSKKLKMTMTKGQLAVDFADSLHDDAELGPRVPDGYELTIWYWNGSKWVEEQNYDVNRKTSATIKLKKANTYYKILVDSYSAKTTAKTYAKSGTIYWSEYTYGLYEEMDVHSFSWATRPKWTIKNSQNCTLYNSNPIK